MEMIRIKPCPSDQMSRETGRHLAARRKAYPLRRLARVFRFFGFATLTYALAIVGIAIDAAIIEF